MIGIKVNSLSTVFWLHPKLSNFSVLSGTSAGLVTELWVPPPEVLFNRAGVGPENLRTCIPGDAKAAEPENTL